MVSDLLSMRDALIEVVGSSDHNTIMNWISSERVHSNPCPGKFLLNLTKPKQDTVRKTWEDFIVRLELKKVRKENIDYILSKLADCRTINEAIQSFDEVTRQVKNNLSPEKTEKTFQKRFQ